MKKILFAENISKSYAQKPILSSVSLELFSGQMVALLGESGSGKSTLLHLLAALLQPDEGKVFVDNKELEMPNDKLIAGDNRIKLVKQTFGLYPNVSIRDNIAYALRFYNKEYQQKRVDSLLRFFDIADIQHQLPREVSGGEQQRAAIAQALAEYPRVVLLDEPFNQLDAHNKWRLKEYIKKYIQREKIACLFVSHDVHDVLSMADEVWLMQEGKIIQKGKPEEVYQNPKNRYVAELTGYVSRLKIGEKFQLLRPEEMVVVAQSPIEAIVQESRFGGRDYLIQAQCEGQKLWFYHEKALFVGEKVFLTIRN